MRGARLFLAAALAALPFASAQAQSAEPKIAQAFELGSSFSAVPANHGSPFLRDQERADWSVESSVYSSYSLTFFTPGVSARASLSANATAPADFSFSLDQCWVSATLADGWGLIFGRFELNWKDGGRWNPSDVVNNRAAWGDSGPVAGRDAIELLGSIPLPGCALDLNLATAITSKIDSFSDIPAFAALGSILYPFELRLKATLPPGFFGSGAKPLVGGSVKYSSESFNAYADALGLFEKPLAAELGETASGAFWARWCAGANYAWGFDSSRILKSLSLGLEYLRQDDGLARTQGGDYFGRLESADISSAAALSAYWQEEGLWAGRFFSLYRDYLYAGLGIGGVARQKIDASLSAVVNLDDASFAILSSVTWQPRGLFSLTLSAQNYGGPEGSEGRRLPESARYALGLTKSF